MSIAAAYEALHPMQLLLKSLRRRPGFVIASVLTLTLGIGATTAIFSVADALLLRPLPYPGGARLVQIWNTYDMWRGDEVLDAFWDHVALSYPEYRDLRAQQTSFDDVAIYASTPLTLAGGGDPDEVTVGLASATLLPLLGVDPALGRGFAPNEEGPAARSVAMLSYATWRDRYGSDPAIVGRVISLSGRPFDVIGVLPSGFALRGIDAPSRERPAVWIPVGGLGEEMARGNHSYEALGLLRRGIAIQLAEAETSRILRAESNPSDRGARLTPRQREEVGDAAAPLFLLMTAAGILMLIACGNFTTLLIGEASGRRREMATRVALGAGPGRMLSHLAIEGGFLGLLGAAGGILVALWGLGLMSPFLPPDLLPDTGGMRAGVVLTFAASLGIGTGIGIGLVSGLTIGRWDVARALRGQRLDETVGGRRTQRLVLATQIAFSLILLVTGALLARTSLALDAVDLGFVPEGLVAASVSLPPAYSRSEATQFFLDVAHRLSGAPGIGAATAVSAMPFSRRGGASSFQIVGRETASDDPGPQAQRRTVMSNYHEVLGIPLLEGRLLRASDRVEEAPVALVNQTLARRYWPEGAAVGARIFRDGREWEIVGVVRDVLQANLAETAQPTLYVPFEVAEERNAMTLVVRSGLPFDDVAREIRQAVWGLVPDVPVEDVTTATALVNRSTRDERFRSLLLGVFAVAATLLCATGLFGVTTRVVNARRRELGIRLALGARRAGLVRRMVLEESRSLLAGLVAGILGASIVGIALASFLFGVAPWDPLSFGAAVSVLLLTGATATFLAAWRGAALDPVGAIGSE